MKNLQHSQLLNANRAPSSKSMGHDFIAGSSSTSIVEEKVAHLSLQLNQIIIKPYLQQALDYLKSSKFDAINAYNKLSDQIGNEVRIISQNIDQITNKVSSCQEVIERTQEIIRNKYSNATEEEISSGALNLEYEYNVVAENYELSLQLTQEASKYKSRIENLLSTQGMLDQSSVPAINRIQLETDNLELLVYNLDSTDYAEALSKKQGRRSNVSKVERTPQIQAKQAELANYAQRISSNNIENINKNPNVKDMNRYEDPNNLSLDRKKYPYSKNTDSDSNNSLLLSRDEMKMQKKLYKQQIQIAKMERLNSYREQLEKNENNSVDLPPELKGRMNLFAQKNKANDSRFSNIEIEDSPSVTNAKEELNKFDKYINDNNNLKAFNNVDNNSFDGRSVKVIK